MGAWDINTQYSCSPTALGLGPSDREREANKRKFALNTKKHENSGWVAEKKKNNKDVKHCKTLKHRSDLQACGKRVSKCQKNWENCLKGSTNLL